MLVSSLAPTPYLTNPTNLANKRPSLQARQALREERGVSKLVSTSAHIH